MAPCPTAVATLLTTSCRTSLAAKIPARWSPAGRVPLQRPALGPATVTDKVLSHVDETGLVPLHYSREKVGTGSGPYEDKHGCGRDRFGHAGLVVRYGEGLKSLGALHFSDFRADQHLYLLRPVYLVGKVLRHLCL